MAQGLRAGPDNGARIDAGMFGEAPIFPGDQHLPETRIDAGGGGRQPPQPVPDLKGAQQAAVAGQNLGPGLDRQQRQGGGVDPAPEGRARTIRRRRDQAKRQGGGNDPATGAAGRVAPPRVALRGRCLRSHCRSSPGVPGGRSPKPSPPGGGTAPA